jgi:DNA-binding NarL/FixJ family response regulator
MQNQKLETMDDNRIKLILVDDHLIVRDGIKALLEGNEHFEIIGEADSGSHFFALIKTHIPDVVLLDINLPDISGIEITKKLASEYPDIKVVVLSMYNTEDYIFNAVKAGAKAYLPKTTNRKELQEAVITVSKGDEYFSQAISNVILRSFIQQAKNDESRKDNQLTSRETEILKLFAEGLSNTEIADQLFISVRTVESHKNHIMQKLELKSTVDLIKFAIKNNIIEI